MNTVWIVSALAVGVALGAFYFGGLWLTVRGIPTTKQPEVWLLSSFLMRAAVVLVGFYFAMGGRWERALACLLGFLLARAMLVRWVGPESAAIQTGQR